MLSRKPGNRKLFMKFIDLKMFVMQYLSNNNENRW